MNKTLLVALSVAVLCVQNIVGLPHLGGRRSAKGSRKQIKPRLKKTVKESPQKLSEMEQIKINDQSIDLSTECTEYYFTQNLDHFSGSMGPDDTDSFEQRYYICGKDLAQWTVNDPVFFYVGNEAAVTTYIKYTGLMWESAAQFNALLVFAEHRYYGDSKPFDEDKIMEGGDYIKYCTVDQTLADYAILIDYLKTNGFNTGEDSSASPIIGFGGSYGGMLASWFRAKYPHLMDGAIAGSAPILGLTHMTPETDPNYFAKIETFDASVEGGVDNELCVENFKLVWDTIATYAETESGRETLAEMFELCSIPSESDAEDLIYLVEEAVAYMAMSSYPYPSDYITSAVLGIDAPLPAYPVRTGCNELLTQSFDSDEDRLKAVADFSLIFFNPGGDSVECVEWDDSTSYSDYVWDFLYCYSIMMVSGMDGESDMFFSDLWSEEVTTEWCSAYYAMEITPAYGSVAFGGKRVSKIMSNIVFSNGLLDPWMGGGVMESDIGTSDSLIPILISESGHHTDLMFSDEMDTESIIEARVIELEYIQQWIDEAYADAPASVGVCSANEQVTIKQHPFFAAFSVLL